MKYFIPQEYLPKETWDYFKSKYGNGALGMRYVDSKIPIFMDWLRETLGKSITVNNWHLNLSSDETFDGRCLRLPSDTVYKLYSEHSYGRAIDFDVQGMKAEDVRQLLLTKYSADFLKLGATSMEKNTNWVHVGFADFSSGWSPEKQNGIYLLNA